MNALNIKHATTVICLISSLSLCACSVQATEKNVWSRGFSWVVNKNTGAFRFMLTNLDQSEHELTGQFSYENYAVDDQVPPTAVIEGVRTKDGRFWPCVTFKAKREPDGKWEILTGPPTQGRHVTISVGAHDINQDLMVSLDVFKPLIGRYDSGRVILPDGETAEFELKYLKPVEEKNDSKDENK